MKNQLRELRGARNLSQEELARLAGVSRQTINALEKERYDPSLVLAFRLAAIFEKRVEEIFEIPAGEPKAS